LVLKTDGGHQVTIAASRRAEASLAETLLQLREILPGLRQTVGAGLKPQERRWTTVFDVDCVIVSYNSAHDLPRCISSLQGQVGLRMTITVVDNASADNSASVAAELGVKVVRNEKNRGFAAAVNQGLRGGDSPWVLAFNPTRRSRRTASSASSRLR
jgi:hypothetical protein